MVIKIYIDYGGPSMAVIAVCLLGKFPFEVVADQQSQEFKKINLLKRMPGMLDTQNNLAIGESHAIIRYLVGKYPEHLQEWYPAQLVKRAKIDQYLDFHSSDTRDWSILILRVSYGKKYRFGNPGFNEEKERKHADAILKNFTDHFLKDQLFITGDKPTIADITAFYEFLVLILVSEEFIKWKKIRQWLIRMSQINELIKAMSKYMPKQNPKAKF